jgi:hypothetical protein
MSFNPKNEIHMNEYSDAFDEFHVSYVCHILEVVSMKVCKYPTSIIVVK